MPYSGRLAPFAAPKYSTGARVWLGALLATAIAAWGAALGAAWRDTQIWPERPDDLLNQLRGATLAVALDLVTVWMFSGPQVWRRLPFAAAGVGVVARLLAGGEGMALAASTSLPIAWAWLARWPGLWWLRRERSGGQFTLSEGWLVVTWVFLGLVTAGQLPRPNWPAGIGTPGADWGPLGYVFVVDGAWLALVVAAIDRRLHLPRTLALLLAGWAWCWWADPLSGTCGLAIPSAIRWSGLCSFAILAAFATTVAPGGRNLEPTVVSDLNAIGRQENRGTFKVCRRCLTAR